MSLYNMITGATGATFFVLPVLGKHPEEYPRFRDCFLGDEEHPEYNGKIQIYTRVGGGNRDDYEEEIAALRKMPGFIADFDDSFDSTFASFVFDIPEKWQADIALYLLGKVAETSAEYQELILNTFPKIREKVQAAFNLS